MRTSGIGLAWPEELFALQSHGDINTKLECIVIKRKGAGRQRGMGEGEKQRKKVARE